MKTHIRYVAILLCCLLGLSGCTITIATRDEVLTAIDYPYVNYESVSGVVPVSDGFVVVGIASRTNKSNRVAEQRFSKRVALILKINANGERVWEKDLYESPPAYSSTGGYIQQVSDVQATADGGFVALLTVTNAGGYGPLLIKTNAAGEVMWSKRIEGAGFPGSATGVSVIQTSDGGFALTGYFFANGTNFYTTRTDANGVLSWFKTLTDTPSYGRYLLETSDGNLLVSGTRETGTNQVMLIKFSRQEGTVIWQKNYEQRGPTFLLPGSNGEVKLVGNSLQGTVNQGFVLRIGSDGSLIQQQLFPAQNLTLFAALNRPDGNADLLLHSYASGITNLAPVYQLVVQPTGQLADQRLLGEVYPYNYVNDRKPGTLVTRAPNGDLLLIYYVMPTYNPTQPQPQGLSAWQAYRVTNTGQISWNKVIAQTN